MPAEQTYRDMLQAADAEEEAIRAFEAQQAAEKVWIELCPQIFWPYKVHKCAVPSCVSVHGNGCERSNSIKVYNWLTCEHASRFILHRSSNLPRYIAGRRCWGRSHSSVRSSASSRKGTSIKNGHSSTRNALAAAQLIAIVCVCTCSCICTGRRRKGSPESGQKGGESASLSYSFSRVFLFCSAFKIGISCTLLFAMSLSRMQCLFLTHSYHFTI